MVAERSIAPSSEGDIRQYAMILTLALLLPIAVVFAVNAVIDPLLYRWPRATWLPGAAYIQFDREAHYNLIAHASPKSLILGNSQTQHGIVPDKWKAPPPVVNGGMVGADLPEIRRSLRIAQRGGRVEQAILGVDFTMAKGRVGPPPTTHDDYLVSSSGAIRPANLRGLLSFTLLRTSISQFANSTIRRIDYFGSKGEALDRLYESSTGGDGGTLGAMAQRLGQFQLNLRAAPNDFEAQLRGLRDEACTGVTTLRVYLTPLHALWRSAIVEEGQLDALEAWKRAITRIASERPGCGFELWDFNTINPVTTEALPPARAKDALRASWDGVHFKPWVGDRILERMGQGSTAPDGFGVLLTPATIEDALARDRLAAERYRASEEGKARAADIVRRAAPEKP